MSEVKLLTTTSDSTMSKSNTVERRPAHFDQGIANNAHIDLSRAYKKLYAHDKPGRDNNAIVMLFINSNMSQTREMNMAIAAIANCFLTPSLNHGEASITNQFLLKNEEYYEFGTCAFKYHRSNYITTVTKLVDSMYNGGFSVVNTSDGTVFDTIENILDTLKIRELDLTFTAFVFDKTQDEKHTLVSSANLIWYKDGNLSIRYALDTTIKAVANNLGELKIPNHDTDFTIRYKSSIDDIYALMHTLNKHEINAEGGLTLPAIIDDIILTFASNNHFANMASFADYDNIEMFIPKIDIPIVKAVPAAYLVSGPSYYRNVITYDSDFKAIARANYTMLDYLQKTFGRTINRCRSTALDLFLDYYDGDVIDENDDSVLSLFDYKNIPNSPEFEKYSSFLGSYSAILNLLNHLRQRVDFINSLVDAKYEHCISADVFIEDVVRESIGRVDVNTFTKRLAACVLRVDELQDFTKIGGNEYDR